MHTISIVIPVYNEEERIGACLEAIAAQTVQPLEVIVVDNNSDDSTVAIASRFDFIKILHEPRQGVVHARNTGFDAARGDIIGRIDADTILAVDWVETLQRIFKHSQVSAVSGSVTYNDMALRALVDRVDLFWRRHFAKVLGREVALQGANMALRRSTWVRIRPKLCCHGGLHEDFDIAIHTTQLDGVVQFREELRAVIGYRRTGSTFAEFAHYALLSPRTYARHGLRSQRHMYPLVALLLMFYIPLKLLNKGYDHQAERFSLRTLLTAPQTSRVNPATYVD